VHQNRSDQSGSSCRIVFNSSLIRAACSRPRSSSKCSSGTVRVVSARAARDLRKPAALCNPSSARAFSVSSPGTLTMTRAWDRSLVTNTPVMVTKPTRGSRTSRANPSVITCLSVSAICSGRRDEPFIGTPSRYRQCARHRLPPPSDRPRARSRPRLSGHFRWRHRQFPPAATDPGVRFPPPTGSSSGASPQSAASVPPAFPSATGRRVGEAPRWEWRQSAPSSSLTRSRLQRPLDLFHPERLDPVAHFEIVEVLDPDAALETFPDLSHIVLEAFEAGERAGVHRGAVAGDPGLGGPLNGSAAYHAPGDGADLAHLEELEHLSLPKNGFPLLRLEQSFERVPNILDRFVDDAIGPHVYLLPFGC